MGPGSKSSAKILRGAVVNDSPVDCQSRGRPSAQFTRERVPGGAPLFSSIAQSVERMTVNHDVTGSSPVRGAISSSEKSCFFLCFEAQTGDTSLTAIVCYANDC